MQVYFLNPANIIFNLFFYATVKQKNPAVLFSLRVIFYFAGLKLSLSLTERLNTNLSFVLSLLSTQKYPWRIN